MALYVLSFLVNILITGTISFGIFRNHPGMTEVYRANSPARQILGCVYLTIGLVSAYALVQTALGQVDIARMIASTLFPLQILYKVMTIWAVRLLHPVVIANIGVSVLLAITLLFG